MPGEATKGRLDSAGCPCGVLKVPWWWWGGVMNLFLGASLVRFWTFPPPCSHLLVKFLRIFLHFLVLCPLENITNQTRRKHVHTLIGGTQKTTKKARQYFRLAMRVQRLANHLQLCFRLLLGSAAGSEGALFMCTQTCAYLCVSVCIEPGFSCSGLRARRAAKPGTTRLGGPARRGGCRRVWGSMSPRN